MTETKPTSPVTSIPRHQRMMRNGWCIPQSLEWLFWPIGFKLPTRRFVDEGPDEIYEREVPRGDLIQESLARRFKMTNRDAFLAQLRRLGAVREQKP